MGDNVRIRGLDGLKGAVIIGIVFAHLVLLNGMNREGGGEMPLYMQTLYLALMTFFIISGYVFKPDRGFKANMRPRLLIPIAMTTTAIIFPLVIYAWATIFGQCPGLDDLTAAILQGFRLQNVFEDVSIPLTTPVSFVSVGCYYLWAMFFGFMIFYALADRVYGNRKLELISIAVLLVIQCLYVEFVHLSLPLALQLAPIAAAFMLIGMMMSEGKSIQRVEEFHYRDPMYWAPMAVCLLIGGVLVCLFHPEVFFDQCMFGTHGGYSVFPFFLEASAFFVVFVYIMNLVARVPLLRVPFLEMGKHTLGTLLLHGFLVKIMLMPFFTFTIYLMPDVDKILAAAIVVVDLVLCYMICTYGPKVISGLRKKTDAENC